MCIRDSPYKRVIPASKSKPSKKAKAEKPTQNQESTKGKEENEVLDYYSGEEVMSIYKVKKSWLYTDVYKRQGLVDEPMPEAITRTNSFIPSGLRLSLIHICGQDPCIVTFIQWYGVHTLKKL